MAQVRSVKALFSIIPLCLLGIFSCKPGPGSSCSAREMRCLDAKRAIVCDDGKFVETPCKGKAGCLTQQESRQAGSTWTSCDISGNQPGDACGKDDEGIAVCEGDKSMLACHGRKYEAVPCRGPRGCEMVGAQANCDQSIAEAGEPCKKDNAKACSADQSQVLSCKAGRLAQLYLCRGETHCSSVGGKLACDQTVAHLGDVCDKTMNGSTACSDDKKSVLICQSERFVSSEKCKPGTTCAVSGQSTKCEKPEKP
ncbi:MAG TPA: hypothetical protein VNG33_02455 [Polyangiaceae bacterium]|nr:hypothetical protein [Polyangiaceae bacterium]